MSVKRAKKKKRTVQKVKTREQPRYRRIVKDAQCSPVTSEPFNGPHVTTVKLLLNHLPLKICLINGKK